MMKTFDINSYEDCAKMMNGSIVRTGENSDGEICLCECIPAKDDVPKHYELRTFQKNGWTKVHGYYPDGTVTETFEDYIRPDEE